MKDVTPTLCHWERRKEFGFFKAFWESLKLSLLEPSRFFETVPTQGDYTSPIIYGMLCSSIGILFATFYQLLFQSLAVVFQLIFHQPLGELMLGTGVYVVIAIATVLAAPVASFVNLFLYSGVYHLFLWMLGGNKKGYEATFRAYAYSQGPQLLQIIPLFGSFVTFIWQYVILIIGFKKLHQTSTGQAVAAAFLPLVLICGLTVLAILGIVFLIIFIIGTAAHQGRI